VLGQTLLEQGRYAEARASTRRALDLLPPGAPLRRVVQRQLQQCEALLALDRKLAAVLGGEASPAGAGEAVALAWLCRRPARKRHAAAARLYADAFAADPRLADDLARSHRYDAACSAVLAAAGQDTEAGRLPDKVVGMFRGWALGWLRADLRAYTRLAGGRDPKAKEAVRRRLGHWQQDADLVSVRDPAGAGPTGRGRAHGVAPVLGRRGGAGQGGAKKQVTGGTGRAAARPG
jgi:hypothetical protein